MKTKDAKKKKSSKQTPAALTKDKPAHQNPQKTQADDGTPDQTPEPPQMMHPLSSEERERKKDKRQ